MRTFSSTSKLAILVGSAFMLTTQFGRLAQEDSSVGGRLHSLTNSWSPFKFSPSPRDLTRGHWEPSDERRAEAGLWRTSDCRVDYSDGAEKHDLRKENQQRLERVSAWAWVPDDGQPVVEWVIQDFVERMIQSRYGLLMIGDSLSEGTWESLRRLLTHPGGGDNGLIQPFKLKHVHSGGSYVNQTTYHIDPKHPMYFRLKAKYPHIPESRFDEPIVRGIRTDVIYTNAELASVLREVGFNGTVPDKFRSQGDWRQVLQDLAKAPTWRGELPGFVMINTGAHWSSDRTGASDEEILKTYSRMVTMVRDTINAASKTLPMRAFYRSVSPAHPGCQNHDKPVQSGDPITHPAPGPLSHHLFSKYNDVARGIIPPLSQSDLNHISFYDIWDMSVLRADAHSGYMGHATFDCLHWCSPSVMEWWLRLLWSHIVELGW
ncbi:hypothetical protein FRB99_004044 [Tulasnella sp. 403]|nr:hypothetical protein FRB99_004044 [Tulasnella sp. 403]